jgi:hypothetical protein
MPAGIAIAAIRHGPRPHDIDFNQTEGDHPSYGISRPIDLSDRDKSFSVRAT